MNYLQPEFYTQLRRVLKKKTRRKANYDAQLSRTSTVIGCGVSKLMQFKLELSAEIPLSELSKPKAILPNGNITLQMSEYQATLRINPLIFEVKLYPLFGRLAIRSIASQALYNSSCTLGERDDERGITA